MRIGISGRPVSTASGQIPYIGRISKLALSIVANVDIHHPAAPGFLGGSGNFPRYRLMRAWAGGMNYLASCAGRRGSCLRQPMVLRLSSGLLFEFIQFGRVRDRDVNESLRNGALLAHRPDFLLLIAEFHDFANGFDMRQHILRTHILQ
jgi:hypothetical protein